MILGSDEMSIYAYKLALMFKDKKDGNINLIISNLYDKVNDRLNACSPSGTPPIRRQCGVLLEPSNSEPNGYGWMGYI